MSRRSEDGGGRAGIVMNGSPLFNGAAESGPSDIRKWLLENDLVDSIVTTPNTRARIRSWRLHLRSGARLTDLAHDINPIVRGWINYYGRYYPSALIYSLNRINDYLVRWTVQKYKRYRRRWMRARDSLGRAAALRPGLFTHWKLGKP